MNGLLDRLGEFGLVPVIKIENVHDILPLADALKRGGLPCMEITFRTDAAEGAIQRVVSKIKDMLVGAGTVLTIEQAQKAASAGAQFIVSPGFNPALVQWCIEQNLPVIPGVATATEIQMALEKGIHILKFFPAEAAGGIRMLQALAPVFPDVRYFPTGGIGLENLATYLKTPAVLACGGSWMATAKLISGGSFLDIERLTREAVQVVKETRNPRG